MLSFTVHETGDKFKVTPTQAAQLALASKLVHLKASNVIPAEYTEHATTKELKALARAFDKQRLKAIEDLEIFKIFAEFELLSE